MVKTERVKEMGQLVAYGVSGGTTGEVFQSKAVNGKKPVSVFGAGDAAGQIKFGTNTSNAGGIGNLDPFIGTGATPAFPAIPALAGARKQRPKK